MEILAHATLWMNFESIILCQQIWKTQQWPQDWKRSVFIPIPKKDNAKECSNYHIIALISHANKAMLNILQARLQQVYVKTVHCHPTGPGSLTVPASGQRGAEPTAYSPHQDLLSVSLRLPRTGRLCVPVYHMGNLWIGKGMMVRSWAGTL